jgi:hypothetical protein
MAVNKKITIFWDMTICSKTVVYYRFAATFSYHCPSRKDPEDGGKNFLRNNLRTDSISFFFLSLFLSLTSAIRRMRIACWIPKATNTHSEYATITDFPLQQWLQERASMLRYSTLSVLFTPSILQLHS